MKNVYLISALLSVAATTVVAQTVDFAMVDTDKNGVVSVSEINAAIPTLTVVDANSDNILSEEEAVAAVKGLELAQETEGEDNATVSEADFALLVAALASAQ